MYYGIETFEKYNRKNHRKKAFFILLIAFVVIGLSILGAIKLAQHVHSQPIAKKESTMQQQEKQRNNTQKSKNEAKPETRQTNEGLTKDQWNAIDNIYASKGEKRVFLTFDDGPSSSVTPKILEILKQENVKATFFVLGTMAKDNPEMLKQERNEGHYIANHGYSHVYSKVYATEKSALEEYQKTESIIQNALKDETYHSNVFRFPGGSVGGYYDETKSKARNILKEKGIAYLDWNCLTNDAAGADTKEEQLSYLKRTAKSSSIVVLMHDAPNKKVTAETLPEVIAFFKEKGYVFKNLYDIL